MVSIDVMGGSTEISGNKILVEHKGTRILLDFGMSFGQQFPFYLPPHFFLNLNPYSTHSSALPPPRLLLIGCGCWCTITTFGITAPATAARQGGSVAASLVDSYEFRTTDKRTYYS